ncbi:MAG: proline--tRNA ligase [Planctomycetes bacterium]|nr:proline--tRNA ligase [Planctomycetota bacterium]
MRWSRTLIPTLKEDPADAEVVSHKLMVRAGLMRKLASGAYTYMPLGFRALNKALQIVREEMDNAGAIEILMPAVHPAELWEKTGRLAELGDTMMHIYDRQNRHFVLGPTHEEIVTDLVSREVKSYKQLPLNLYQIQTKFRDEIRPRFGVLRTREFIMKDAYSFDVDAEGLEKSYQAMYDAYCKIMERCGLKYIVVEAESGAMGGDVSAEFMVPCSAGEDLLATCTQCDYAANMERTQPAPLPEAQAEEKPLTEKATPGARTIEQVCEFLKAKPKKLVKTIIYKAGDETIAALVRGDHEVNEAKLARLLGCEIETADAEAIEKATGAPVGFAGPVGLGIKIIADQGVLSVRNFVTGANKADTHYLNVNLGRDFKPARIADIRFAVEGDNCHKCGAALHIQRGIEIGHVFKLGTKYSKKLGADYLDENGQTHPAIMGCYGIGINRIIAAAIEMSHDDKGIIWPAGIAPYQVEVIPLNLDMPEIIELADKVYAELDDAGLEVLMDDRDERPGVKFNDADLIGLPVRVVVGKKAMAQGGVEMKLRGEPGPQLISPENVIEEVKKRLES